MNKFVVPFILLNINMIIDVTYFLNCILDIYSYIFKLLTIIKSELLKKSCHFMFIFLNTNEFIYE